MRIILDHQTSEVLSSAGEPAFMIIGRASYPDDPTRWVIHVVACPMATAAAACEVATGQRKAGRRLASSKAPPATGCVDSTRPLGYG